MYNIVLAVHIVFAVAMIGLILIQHGKGADAGASFGAGAAGTVFGASGSANFLSRATAILAGLFFITSLSLAAFARKEAADQLRLDVVDTAPVTAPVMPHSPVAAPAPAQVSGEPAAQEQTVQAAETTPAETTPAKSDTQSTESKAESPAASDVNDKSTQTTTEQAAGDLDDITKPVFSEKDTSNPSANKK